MAGDNEFCFRQFFEEEWMGRQQCYLNQLLCSQNQSEDELKGLIACVLAHYQQYYAAKSMAARQDVFSLFAPTWLSTYERAFLWITGFKPGLAFSLLAKSVNDLSEDQSEGITRVQEEMRVKEEELNNELAMFQESAAAADLVELGRQWDGASLPVDDVLVKVKGRMESLVNSADCLRMWTARETLEILRPVQSVKLLAAAAKFQIKIRSLGKDRDAQRSTRHG